MMDFALSLLATQTALIGAFVGWYDGQKDSRAAYIAALFFILACIPYAGWWSVLGGLSILGIVTGHGQYFLQRQWKRINPERLDFIVQWFFGKDPRTLEFVPLDPETGEIEALYWRNVFGMFVTGLAVGLPAVVVLLFSGAYFPAILLSLTGVAKAGAYMIAHKIGGAHENPIAEALNGGFRSWLCALAFLVGVA